MLELTKTTIEVKIEGKVYTMRMPTYKEGINYKTELKALGDDEIKTSDLLISYLDKLGLPKEVSETLDVFNLEQILDFVRGAKKK